MHYMPPCSDLRSTHNLSTLSGDVLCSDRGRARVLVSGEETQHRPLRRPGLRRFQGGLDSLGTHVKAGAISTPLHLTYIISLLMSTQYGVQRTGVVTHLLD